MPWLYILLSSTCAILEDISMFANIYQVHGLWDKVFFAMSPLTCILVGTPMIPVLLLWCASKEYRVGGKGPMIFLAPLIRFDSDLLSDCRFCDTQPDVLPRSISAGPGVRGRRLRDSLANLLVYQQAAEPRSPSTVRVPTHTTATIRVPHPFPRTHVAR